MARRYNQCNEQMPTVVQAVTAGCIASVGDLICQTKEGHRFNWWLKMFGNREADSSNYPLKAGYDWMRTGRLAAFRLFIFGPCYSIWLRHLHRNVSFPSKWRTVTTQIILDQFLMAPPFLSGFFMFMSLSEGNSLDQSVERTKSTLWPTVKVNWCFWIPVQLINFGFVPKGLQVAFVSTIQVGWNAWLSGVNNDARVAIKNEFGKSLD